MKDGAFDGDILDKLKGQLGSYHRQVLPTTQLYVYHNWNKDTRTKLNGYRFKKNSDFSAVINYLISITYLQFGTLLRICHFRLNTDTYFEGAI